MTRSFHPTAARCFLLLALTTGASQAVETWDVKPAGGGGTQEADEPEEPASDEPVELSCGEKSDPFDIPVANHTAVASAHDDASFAVAAQALYNEVGLGRPSCNSSNCGFAQTCPSAGGSQTISGGVSASWRGPGSRYVDLDIKPGTQGVQTCADCS